jgi:hypothetical protein
MPFPFKETRLVLNTYQRNRGLADINEFIRVNGLRPNLRVVPCQCITAREVDELFEEDPDSEGDDDDDEEDKEQVTESRYHGGNQTKCKRKNQGSLPFALGTTSYILHPT